MDKKSKDTIKEVIEELLKLRTEKLHQDRIVQLSSYSSDKKNYDDKRKAMKKHQLKTISMFDKPLVKLNHLLDKKEQNKEVIDLEQQMKKIQAKKYISVKELSEIYNISKKRFDNGLITSKEFIQNQIDYISNKQDNINSEIDYILAVYEYKKFIGLSLFDN